MPENMTISCSLTGSDENKKDNNTSRSLVPVGDPKEVVEIVHENKTTNTEGVNRGIYFSYPCRRRSCALVNIPAPCVNKMISHIEDVESKIQEHVKQFETSFEEWSSTSTKDVKDWSIATPEKEVKPEEERGEKCSELKQEMETLLSEAIHLIKSLETDRAEAEEALKEQQSRRKQINGKIDSWSIWRLQEIPFAVQKEHETYLRDIIELRCHLEDKGHQLKHLEKEKAKLEEANAKLQADVDYMKKHGPLLNSKWNQELEAVKEFSKKKIEVMGLYKRVQEELKEAIGNCQKAQLKAKKFREDMEKDINNEKINIDTYKKEIENINNLCNYYNKLIKNVNVTIEENEEAVTEALKETKTSKDELSALSKVLADLKKVYDQLAYKQKSYENEYLEAFNDFYAKKKIWDTELSNIGKDFSAISEAYTQLMEENKRIAMDIETISNLINDSVRKKSVLDSEIQYLRKLKSKNDNYLKQLYREAYGIGSLFHVTRYKTEELEEKIAEARRKFKGREEFLKRQTRSEVANGMLIQKRLFHVQEELALEKQDLLKKKAIYSQILAEIEEPLLQMEEDAERMKTVHEEHSGVLTHIIEKRKYVKKKVKKTKKKLLRKGKETQEALTEAKEKCSIIFNEIKTAKSKTIVYQEKISKLNDNLDEKEKEKKNLEQILENLKEQFLTIRFKKEHAQAVYDHLISEQKACRERISEEEQRFGTLVAMRQKTLKDIKKLQVDSLEENLRLAQEYQKLQTTFLTEKYKYFNLYDKQLSLDASIRDKKQLCQLQRRIHKVWQKYFKLVVLYSQMKLAKFQTDSQESIQKILAVQEESSNLIQHIVDFFQTLSEGPCENDG
uniref:Coiled-coil domain containing 178 n=1 Tax=Rousettus aegyptiacus TaxID=9407 RepID=A0A7J8DFG4_ROUAE|nr:coiled-coil domain containing 178 [Rousettus aegyptiacus]